MRKQTDSDLRSEANAFTDLARKLLAVPKKEVNKEKAKYEKQRENKKRAK
jgi:hypothetical protein